MEFFSATGQDSDIVIGFHYCFREHSITTKICHLDCGYRVVALKLVEDQAFKRKVTLAVLELNGSFFLQCLHTELFPALQPHKEITFCLSRHGGSVSPKFHFIDGPYLLIEQSGILRVFNFDHGSGDIVDTTAVITIPHSFRVVDQFSADFPECQWSVLHLYTDCSATAEQNAWLCLDMKQFLSALYRSGTAEVFRGLYDRWSYTDADLDGGLGLKFTLDYKNFSLCFSSQLPHLKPLRGCEISSVCYHWDRGRSSMVSLICTQAKYDDEGKLSGYSLLKAVGGEIERERSMSSILGSLSLSCNCDDQVCHLSCFGNSVGNGTLLLQLLGSGVICLVSAFDFSVLRVYKEIAVWTTGCVWHPTCTSLLLISRSELEGWLGPCSLTLRSLAQGRKIDHSPTHLEFNFKCDVLRVQGILFGITIEDTEFSVPIDMIKRQPAAADVTRAYSAVDLNPSRGSSNSTSKRRKKKRKRAEELETKNIADICGLTILATLMRLRTVALSSRNAVLSKLLHEKAAMHFSLSLGVFELVSSKKKSPIFSKLNEIRCLNSASCGGPKSSSNSQRSENGDRSCEDYDYEGGFQAIMLERAYYRWTNGQSKLVVIFVKLKNNTREMTLFNLRLLASASHLEIRSRSGYCPRLAPGRSCWVTMIVTIDSPNSFIYTEGFKFPRVRAAGFAVSVSWSAKVASSCRTKGPAGSALSAFMRISPTKVHLNSFRVYGCIICWLPTHPLSLRLDEIFDPDHIVKPINLLRYRSLMSSSLHNYTRVPIFSCATVVSVVLDQNVFNELNWEVSNVVLDKFKDLLVRSGFECKNVGDGNSDEAIQIPVDCDLQDWNNIHEAHEISAMDDKQTVFSFTNSSDSMRYRQDSLERRPIIVVQSLDINCISSIERAFANCSFLNAGKYSPVHADGNRVAPLSTIRGRCCMGNCASCFDFRSSLIDFSLLLQQELALWNTISRLQIINSGPQIFGCIKTAGYEVQFGRSPSVPTRTVLQIVNNMLTSDTAFLKLLFYLKSACGV